MDQKIRILVVDDDETIRTVFRTIHVAEGYDVETAANGVDAIEKSKTAFFNLALVDIRLQDMEGTMLLTAMKETVPKMRKIIVTGHPDVLNAIAAVKGGADDYLIKPAKLEDLVKSVREQLRKQSEESKYSETKVSEFVESRIKHLESAADTSPKDTAP